MEYSLIGDTHHKGKFKASYVVLIETSPWTKSPPNLTPLQDQFSLDKFNFEKEARENLNKFNTPLNNHATTTDVVSGCGTCADIHGVMEERMSVLGLTVKNVLGVDTKALSMSQLEVLKEFHSNQVAKLGQIMERLGID